MNQHDTHPIRAAVLAEREAPGPLSKSSLGGIGPGQALNIRDELPTPMLTVDTETVVSNIEQMAEWTAEQGVQLAPHGKTTMTPALWRAQLAAGAVGITVANFSQARVAVEAGAPLVVIANEFLTPPGLSWLRGVLAEDGPEIMCWADSVRAVERMQSALGRTRRRVQVCVEVGIEGKRAGVRQDGDVGEIVEALTGAEALAFAGFSGFEGVLPPERIEEVRSYLRRMARLFEEHEDRIEVDHPVLTAGGGLYFDLVAELLRPAADSVDGGRVILRPGSYLLHDHGHYGRLTPARLRGSGPQLRPAATLWARVLSTPEQGLAILDAGKRDLAYDISLPRPQRIHRADGRIEEFTQAELVDTNDQHGYLEHADQELEIGDVIEFGQSHPCTIADKWRELPLVTAVEPGRLRWDASARTHF
ncbi:MULTISPECIES: alanine racemase [Nesterenkonia]|uniref:D-serine deaminase-like pyridoxal phosphate-dependent protein n=1 Tax=Nesterenkonia xinjiangensis TaxID=225327 RepID=A0A7Z0GNH9_9MICC|nr:MULTISPECIES: alanine racemase [Nesterenkonia]MDZ5077771.1 alanine racemase [Nesterenkonia sp. HG001]NYJ78744.1 D-serine deaminase-like pyridoxal phosphate-dependent protein [Nesterenkonia xinjiangensis]